ncbi:hypothetical protein [Nesterenkonia ebinurensis]|uniref:hypothetical protein n=1 Tax=Nesterenkonia ebinurensis TaxID=2608252 RepID=UPI00123D73FD|nr:hypothetical protein [Nesterenkonia ebinurensis]
MRYYRTTSNGRRISAEPRVRKEPDTKRLVALVLHLADQLHAEDVAEAHRRAGDAREDHNHPGPAAVTGERGNEDDDTPGFRTRG